MPLSIERLERRIVLSPLAQLTLNPTGSAIGSFLANQAEYAQITIPDGRLTATATGAGFKTSLSLIGTDGATLLAQSDGQVGNPTDLITQYLPAGTYYLKVSGVGGAGGNFTISTSFQGGVLPLKNIPFGQTGSFNPAMVSGVFTSGGHIDLVTADPNSNTISVMLGNGDGTFQQPVVFNVNPNPSANPEPVQLVAGNFGNGTLDIATVNMDGTVSVLLGNGDGTFQPAQVYSLGPNATTANSRIIAVDLGNGRTDLVAACQFVDSTGKNLGAGTVAVLLGNGNGTFQSTPLTYAVGSNPSFVVAANFGNGHIDLATADTDTVSVLLGKGDGTFSAVTSYNVDVGGKSAVPTRLVAADFGNGHVDLAAVDSGTNGVSVLIGRGDGTFLPATFYAVGSNPDALVAADFGNGHIDLVTANFGNPQNVNVGLASNTVSVLIGRGDGTFLPATTYQIAGSGPMNLVAADFGNGHLDIVTADNASDTVSVLLGNGDGTFQKSTAYAAGIGPVDLLAADFGNGHMDLAAVSDGMPGGGGTEAVTILLGNGDGTFQASTRNQVGSAPTYALTADLGNGHLDIVTANISAGTISVLLGNGDGTFQPAVSYAVGLSPDYIVAADFNNDGHLDLAVSNQGMNGVNSTVSILMGNGDGTFQKAVNYHVGPANSLVAANFGNGFLDLATVNQDGTVSVLMGNGKGVFAAAKTYQSGIQDPTSIVAANFGNGHTDLAVANPTTGAMSVLLGSGTGVFQPGVVYGAARGPDFGINRLQGLVVGDFGNGMLDLALPASNVNSVLVFLGIGNGKFATNPLVYAVGTNPIGIIGVKLANTQIIDLVTVDDPQLGTPGAVSVLVGNGNGTFQNAVNYSVGTFPDAIAAGNFNGNEGLAVVNNGDNTVSVLLGNGNGTLQPAKTYPAGDAPDFLVAGDFGNGATDLAATNFNTDSVTVLLNAGGGSFVPSNAVVPQQAVPLLADFTGSGALDAVIVDQAGNILYRPGSTATPGVFGSAVIVNPSAPAQAATLVTTPQGILIAAIDDGSNTISLYQRNSNGTFSNVGTLATGASPTRIIAADLAGDSGRLADDLAVLNSSTGTLTIYLYSPGSGFLPGTSYPVGVGASAVTVAPDAGHLDLLVTNQVSGDVTVLVNNGNGAFTPTSRYRAGAGPYSSTTGNDVVSFQGTNGIVAGPLATGGPIGAVAINAGSQTFGVLEGQGGASFLNPVISGPLGFSPAFIAGGDFTNNGQLDFVVLNKAAGTLSVYLGNGLGGFTQKVALDASGKPLPLNVGSNVTGIAVANINGDAFPDLVIGNAFGDLLVLLGNGDGTFRYLDTQSQIPLAATHLGGKNVFVFANSSLNHISLQYGGTAPTVFQGLQNGILNPGAVKLADLNGDGIQDLIVVDSGRNSVLVYPGLGNGQFGPELNGGQGFAVGDDPVSVTVGDLSGTGQIGLVVANRGSNDVSILYVARSATGWTLNEGPRVKTGGQGPTSAVIASVTGNGLPDIIATNQDSNNVALLPGVGNGFFHDATQTFTVGSAPAKILLLPTSIGLEMATIDSGSGTVTTFEYVGNGFAPLGTASTGGTDPVDAITVSINGAEDLVIANNGNGLATLLVNGESGLQIAAHADLPNASSLADISDSTGLQIYGTSVGVEEAQLLFTFGISPPSVPTGPGVEVVASGASLGSGNLPVGALLLSVAAGPGGELAESSNQPEGGAFAVGFFLGASRTTDFSGAVHSGDNPNLVAEVMDRDSLDEVPGLVPPPQIPLIKFLTGTDQVSVARSADDVPLARTAAEQGLFDARLTIHTGTPLASEPESSAKDAASAAEANATAADREETSVFAGTDDAEVPATQTVEMEQAQTAEDRLLTRAADVQGQSLPIAAMDAERRETSPSWLFGVSAVAVSSLALLWQEEPPRRTTRHPLLSSRD
jgi:hypothetical protein